MFSKPLVFGLLALGSLTAAAGGAYVAARHNAAEVQVTSEPITAPTSASTPTAAKDQGVRETEATVSPAPPSAAPAQTPEPSTPAPAASVKAAPERHAAAERSSPTAAAKSHAVKPPASSRPVDVVAKNHPAQTAPAGAHPVASQVPPAPAVESSPAPVPSVPPPSASEQTKSAAAEAPRAPQFEELVLPASSVIGLQLESALTSEHARVEDRVEARVTRDVLVDGRVAIPAGSRVLGSVTQVDRGGKVRDRAHLAIRFHTLVLGDGSEVPLRTETIMRDGEAPAADSTKKIGGAAVGGAILGAILGGGKGAMIGGMAGAGGGTAIVMAGDRNPAAFQPGTIVTARLAAPATIQVRRQQ
ncbi:MAG TPA: TrbI/VirB10 family protein [Vicinamibacterales bacterium]|nr:TrbI/VirB10 family protein [Vicinamibacterales bacterium]